MRWSRHESWSHPTDPRFQAFGLLATTLADVQAGRFDARRAEAHLGTARKVFEAGGDDVGLAWAGFLEAHMRWMRGQAALAATAAQQAEAHARAAGDDPLAASMRSMTLMALSFGPASRRRSLGRWAGPAGRRERHGRSGLRPALRRQAACDARRPGCGARARASGIESSAKPVSSSRLQAAPRPSRSSSCTPARSSRRRRYCAPASPSSIVWAISATAERLL